jgi:hypothetical protein
LPAGSSGEIHVDSSSGGRAPLPNNPVNTNDFAVRQRMAALRALVEALVTVPSAKKTVLYFTSCIGFDMLQIADYRGGVLGLAAEDAQRTIAAASRANVVFYPLDPRGFHSRPPA